MELCDVKKPIPIQQEPIETILSPLAWRAISSAHRIFARQRNPGCWRATVEITF
jgi:hypothetical protein